MDARITGAGNSPDTTIENAAVVLVVLPKQGDDATRFKYFSAITSGQDFESMSVDAKIRILADEIAIVGMIAIAAVNKLLTLDLPDAPIGLHTAREVAEAIDDNIREAEERRASNGEAVGASEPV